MQDTWMTCSQPIIRPRASSFMVACLVAGFIVRVKTLSFDPECPCANAAPFLKRLNSAVVTGVFEEEPASNCTWTTYEAGIAPRYCYPETYGSLSCEAWDANLPPFCADSDGNPFLDAPEWCSQRWCFVDFDKCRESGRAMIKSQLFGDNEQRLFVSYDTCNSTASGDSFGDFLTWKSMQGVSVVAGVPYMRSPILYKRDPVTKVPVEWSDDPQLALYKNDTLPWDGSLVQYVSAVLSLNRTESFGKVNYTWTSGGARNSFSSFYTACVYDVHKGLLDFCVGDFWITKERLELTAFTVASYVEPVHIFVPNKMTSADFMTNAYKVFEPFDASVWILIILTSLGVGCVDAWFTAAEWMGDDWDTETFATKAHCIGQAVLSGMYFYTFDFVSMGASGATDLWASRLLKLGWAFFVMIAIAAYTANLAAFLGNSETTLTWSSMADVVNAGKDARVRICTYSAIRVELETDWPEANFVFKGSTERVFKGYEDGECEAFMAAMPTIGSNLILQQKVCDWGFVSAGVVLTIPVAFPASQEVVAALSYWLTRASSEGLNFLEGFHEPTYHSVCSLKIAASNAEDSVKPLQLGNFVGSIAVMVLGTFLGVVIKLCSERDRAAKAIFNEANGSRWSQLMLHARKTFGGSDNNSKDPDVVSVIERVMETGLQTPSAATPSGTPRTLQMPSGGAFGLSVEAVSSLPEKKKHALGKLRSVNFGFQPRRSSWVPKQRAVRKVGDSAEETQQQITTLMLGNIITQLETLSRDMHKLKSSTQSAQSNSSVSSSDDETH
eukprot:CAMPEP_0114234526 /NCGR_PEP_ID=MMETSP0058-20121206/5756_1 /TAXON_ID=36894 /ORGANISM="Pyramimonas parkeae, CCMP726" /LENGTH=782 /DNA_ID=CAMNT_0001346211 /DNA_START=73 /DNA_END=2421 /DNA_ORIENTATION=+